MDLKDDLRTDDDYFRGERSLPEPEDVQEFIISFFKKLTEGPLKEHSINLETRREEFFPADSTYCSLLIGVGIAEKFLGFPTKICFTWSLPNHSFTIHDEESRKAFYGKYPKDTISKQTVKEFSEMIYDLILIENGLPIS